MKEFIIFLVFLMIVTLTACGTPNTETQTTTAETTSESTTEESVGMVNPWTDYSSLEEAGKNVGFEMSAPDKIDGYPNTHIQGMQDEMIQIFYSDKDEDAENRSDVLIRKGKGSDDISGDYTEYSQTESADISGYTVTLKGNDDLIYNVTWSQDGYAYSIVADKGLDRSTVENLVKDIK